MFKKSLLFKLFNYCTYKNGKLNSLNVTRSLYISSVHLTDSKEVIKFENFESINAKNKNTYLEMVKIFEGRDVHRRGHVEFIYSALKNMKHFGVDKDLEVYKALVDVLPKGKFIPTNILQSEFMHYPKQQQCAIDLLEQMEDNGVLPDLEMENILLNVFGSRGFPLRKFWRMMYWMPKFKNLSPWPLPDVIPDDMLELAKLAVARMSSVDLQAHLSVYKTDCIPEAVEDTWIVSSQSETQRKLLAEHSSDDPIYIEGAFKIWVKNKPVNYFTLKADPKPFVRPEFNSDDISKIDVPLFSFTPPATKELIVYPSVHEQEDGVILALCVTGTSGRDSLLSWIRHLEKDQNPKLANIPVVFKLRAPEREIAHVQSDQTEKIEGQ